MPGHAFDARIANETLEQIGNGYLALARRQRVHRPAEEGSEGSRQPVEALRQQRPQVGGIPAEQFVRALADQGHPKIAGRLAGKQRRRQPGRVGQRFADAPHQGRQLRLQVLRTDPHGALLQAETLRHRRRHVALVEGFDVKPDRVGAQRELRT